MTNNNRNRVFKVSKENFIRKEIVDWLKDQISLNHQVTRELIDENESFSSYGLSSMDASELVSKLSSLHHIRLPAHIGYDHGPREFESRWQVLPAAWDLCSFDT